MVVWIPKRVSSTGGASSPDYGALVSMTRASETRDKTRTAGSGEVNQSHYLKALRDNDCAAKR